MHPQGIRQFHDNCKIAKCQTVATLAPVYIRPNLEFCIPAWCPYLSKDIEVMEKVQRRATKMVPELKNLQYEDRLQRLGILNLSARRLRGDLIETFKIMNSLPLLMCHTKDSLRKARTCQLDMPTHVSW